MPNDQKIEYLDITPTPADYTNMARMFASAVVSDARDERRTDTGVMLGSLVELVAYLARIQPDADVLALVNMIKADATR